MNTMIQQWKHETRNTRTEFIFVVAFILFIMILRWVFRFRGLWEWDEVLFTEGVIDFDVAKHYPHPPGFPLYILMGKLLVFFVGDPERALVLLSVFSGVLTLIPLYLIVRRLEGRWSAIFVMSVYSLCPIVWLTGEQALSDSLACLFYLLGIQACISREGGFTRPLLATVFFCFSLGVRPQMVPLVVPLVLLYWLSLPRQPGRSIYKVILPLLFGLINIGWVAIIVMNSGGVSRSIELFTEQGEWLIEADSVIGQGWNTIADRFQRFFLDIWGPHEIGSIILVLGGIGIVSIIRERRAVVLAGLLVMMPSFLFTLMLQNPSILRYMLPFIPYLLYLAVRGLTTLTSFRCGKIALALFTAGICLHLLNWMAKAMDEVRTSPPPPILAIDSILAARPLPFLVIAGTGYQPILEYKFRTYNVPVIRNSETKKTCESIPGFGNVIFIGEDEQDISMISRMNKSEFSWKSSKLRQLSRGRYMTTSTIINPLFVDDGWYHYVHDEKLLRWGRHIQKMATFHFFGKTEENNLHLTGILRGNWHSYPTLIIKTDRNFQFEHVLESKNISIDQRISGKILSDGLVSSMTISLSHADGTPITDNTPAFITSLLWTTLGAE